MSSTSFKDHIAFIIKFGGIYATIASFLTDFFKPVFDSTLVCAGVAAIISLSVIIFYLLKFLSSQINHLNEDLHERTHGYWFKSIFATSILCFIIFSIMYIANRNTPDGYFSEKSIAIRNLQQDFGLIQKQLADIKRDTHKIAEKTNIIEQKTTEISDSSKETAYNTSIIVKSQQETVDLLKESVNPSDPKQKLAKMGLKYEAETYAQKVAEADLEILDLFYNAGMDPHIILLDGTNPIYTAVLKNQNYFRKTLRQAIQYGFDPNKMLPLNPQQQLPIPLMNIINGYFKDNKELLSNANINFSLPSDKQLKNLGFFTALHFLPDEAMLYLITDFNINMDQGIEGRNAILNGIKDNVENFITSYTSGDTSIDINQINCRFNLDKFYKNIDEYNHATDAFRKPNEALFEIIKNNVNDNDPKTIYELAVNYDNGSGVKKDVKKAFELFLKAANMGYAKAQYIVATYYQRGIGTDKNIGLSIEYLQKAADQENVLAQSLLGLCYLNGDGVKQDLKRAIDYLKFAADKNDANAQYNMGFCYQEGKGVTKDLQKAVNYYKLAAAQGNEAALINLGICYLNGNGVPQDQEMALKNFKLAIDKNPDNPVVQNLLGACYLMGYGTKTDIKQARFWLQKAAEQGYQPALQNLKEMEKL